MDVTALILGVALLAASGGLFAASLRLDRLVDFLIAFYLLAFLEVVVVSLALSPARALTRPALLASLAGLLALALVVWLHRGRPAPPARPALHAFREALRDPVLALLAGAVVVALLYLFGLAYFAPPNDYDLFSYHLPRAAFWKQQHAVAYVPNVNEVRINALPPVSEIADAFTMILARSDRFTGFVQLVAFLATMVAILGISRRVGFGPRQALFGTLLFATLPIAVLQAPTALNDVLIASFVAAAVYFLLAGGLTGLVLAELAVALMLGTKPTAVYALPVLVLVGVVAYPPPRRWWMLLLISFAGVAVGSFWYMVNLAETGMLAGGLAASEGVADPDDALQQPLPLRTAAFFIRRVVDAVDPSGSVGRDRWLYGIAAAVVLCVGVLVSLRRRSRTAFTSALLASALTAAALAVRPAYDFLLRAHQKIFFELGYPQLAFLAPDRDPTQASSFQSWFGPLAVPLVLLSAGLVTREVWRRRLPRVAIALALAPALVLLLMAVGARYTPWDGRWAMLAVPLACATWGIVLRFRPLAWAAAAMAATTLALVLVHAYERPAGFNVLGGAAPRSVWTTPREEVMAAYAPFIAVIERRVPPAATLGIHGTAGDLTYPYFGSRLERKVVFVDDDDPRSLVAADWLAESPLGDLPLCRDHWSAVAANSEGWRLFRRTGRGYCPPRNPLLRGARGGRLVL